MKIKKQSNTIKEETEHFLNQQKQQMANTTSNISNITNRVNDNFNEYQKTNNEIIGQGIDTTNKYQQETINTIQSISNNAIELQKNILNTYQSALSRFLNDTSKSYWNNYMYPERYADVYNRTSQNITDNTINANRRINDLLLGSTENFNKPTEIAQTYYNESVHNYFNFVNKIELS